MAASRILRSSVFFRCFLLFCGATMREFDMLKLVVCFYMRSCD